MTESPRPGRPQRPHPGGRPGRADLEQRLEHAVTQIDALAEAIRLYVKGEATSDPAYDAALAVQVRRRNMHVVPQHQEAS